MLDSLNAPQRAAVLHGEGPLLVLAGAGSGKTRVITYRIAELCRRGVHPREILAVTFTNKAAAEMRERVARLLGEERSGVWISTFHSACVRIIRQHASHVGLPRDFVIYDDDDQKKLLTRILAELGHNDRTPLWQVRSRIDQAKNRGITPEQYAREDFVDAVVERVYPIYQDRLRASGAVDFGDLLMLGHQLTAADDLVGKHLRGRFSHVLVDEFQDTNRVQYELVRELSRRTRHLCVVGDDDQSIYRWRGADVGNILDFERDYPDACVIKLEQNYRSTKTILEAANAVIARNPQRKGKTLFTENEQGEPVLLHVAATERHEAAFVGQVIAHMVADDSRSPSDFAIFYRTHAQSRAIEEALRARGLDYRIVGGTRFYERAEVKDLLGYLRLLSNPADELALLRVVNVPTRGIGDATMEKVLAFGRSEGTTPLEALRRAATEDGVVGSGPRKKLATFIELFDALRRDQEDSPSPAALAERVLERTGYQDWLMARDEEATARIENLLELVGDMRTFEAESPDPVTLADYLERVALVSDDDRDGRVIERVTLMTVHGAKGLEFPIVLLCGLEEGLFPHESSLKGDEELAEERRLCYVAITRARERLFLTCAGTRYLHGKQYANAPSRFLADLPRDCLAVTEPAARPERPAPQPRQHHSEEDQPSYDDFDQSSPDDEEPPFWVGQQVRHRLFGVGEVRGYSGHGGNLKLTIEFPDVGRKTIVARFVTAE